MTLYGSKVQEKALHLLNQEISKLLGNYGFEELTTFQWTRITSWRSDEIDLGVKSGMSSLFLPSARVAVPLVRTFSELGEQSQYIAQRNIGRILHPHNGPDYDIKVPSLRFKVQGFLTSVVNDVNDVMPWFEKFKTPELCLINLREFLRPGCPAYQDAEQYLRVCLKNHGTPDL